MPSIKIRNFLSGHFCVCVCVYNKKASWILCKTSTVPSTCLHISLQEIACIYTHSKPVIRQPIPWCTDQNLLLKGGEVWDGSPHTHVIQYLLFGDDLDGVILCHVHITLAVEDLLRLGCHEQWEAILWKLACKTCPHGWVTHSWTPAEKQS